MTATNQKISQVTINYMPTNAGNPLHPLYCQYQGQLEPQSAYIEIDPEDETISADWDGEIGNAVPAAVWHGRFFRFTVSIELTATEINELMDDIKDDATAMISHYESLWDNSNWVGRLSPEGSEIYEKIARICAETQTRSRGVWSADDWISEITDRSALPEKITIIGVGEITAHTTGDEIEEMTTKIEEEAAFDQTSLYRTVEHLENLREECE